MKKKALKLNFITITTLIALALISRIIPHPYNFAPMMAVGIFGGALFTQKKWAYIIPLVAIFLSDLLINNILMSDYYGHFVWAYEGWYWQYAVFALIPFLSVILFKNHISVSKIIGMSVFSSIIFFIVTNFGVWATGMMYPMNTEGLMACFVAGIPFYKGALLGNLFYCGVLFGTYYLIGRKIPSLQLPRLSLN